MGGLKVLAAALVGSDDFEDNFKDPTKWGADTGLGALSGTFTETNGRLEFTTAGTDSFETRPWVLNFGSFVENWEVQLDTTIATVAGFGRFMGLGLEVRRTNNSDLRMGILHESAQSAWDYYSYLLNPDTSGSNSGTLPGAASGAVRIVFDAETKVLSSYYDADGPVGGYAWTMAASFGVTGSGGATGNADWSMTATDEFQILVHASSGSRSVGSGLVYGDNFRAVPEPSSFLTTSSASFLLLFQRRRGALRI